jgi:hypothetical protein
MVMTIAHGVLADRQDKGSRIMIKRKFVCRNCQHEFLMEVYEEGEAEEKRVPKSPVLCPRCGSASIERR